jgi:hypothetical protein
MQGTAINMEQGKIDHMLKYMWHELFNCIQHGYRIPMDKFIEMFTPMARVYIETQENGVEPALFLYNMNPSNKMTRQELIQALIETNSRFTSALAEHKNDLNVLSGYQPFGGTGESPCTPQ